MKKFILFFILSLGGVHYSQAQIDTLVIKSTVQCDMCVERIMTTMTFSKGVQATNVDLKQKLITVVYKAKKTSPEAIREAISNTGYAADEVPANSTAYSKLPGCCQVGGHP